MLALEEKEDVHHPDRKPSRFGAALIKKCRHCGAKYPNQYAPWAGACGRCVALFKDIGMTHPPETPAWMLETEIKVETKPAKPKRPAPKFKQMELFS